MAARGTKESWPGPCHRDQITIYKKGNIEEQRSRIKLVRLCSTDLGFLPILCSKCTQYFMPHILHCPVCLLRADDCIVLFCRVSSYFVTSQHGELAMHEARSAGTAL